MNIHSPPVSVVSDDKELTTPVVKNENPVRGFVVCLSVCLFVCLVFNGTLTQDRSISANYGRVKPTQLAKGGQRDTMLNSQYVTQCNTVYN